MLFHGVPITVHFEIHLIISPFQSCSIGKNVFGNVRQSVSICKCGFTPNSVPRTGPIFDKI